MPSGDEIRRGGCLCGSLRFEVRPTKLEMDVCHCGMCRRCVGGGLFMAIPCGSAFDLTQSATLQIYPSSDYGERLFCRHCGSNIAWRMRNGSQNAVSVQSLDDQSGIVFAEEIFVDEKPATYDFSHHTRKLTGATAMAQFANEQGA